jgi:hypothetical protein
MRIKTTTGLLYDGADRLCRLILTDSQGETFAFVQAIDTGFDGRDRHPVRYWGKYSHDTPEQSVERILATGGKWPKLETAAW